MHFICELDIKTIFAINVFYYLFSWVSQYFEEIKSILSLFSKNNEDRWFLIVHIKFTHQNETKNIRMSRSALFFSEIKSELFFVSLLIGKKRNTYFYEKKAVQKIKNPELSIYFLCESPMQKETYLVLLFKKKTCVWKKNWTLGLTASKFLKNL